ncbi:MAG: prepilin-type N-terminal cleavage/methylation domain-containing protein [Syntrophaceae bacterium]|nr:prepilin-type N-terminal cleavage/methylation domain-containing protein [Syntrophaceae bacterium]
MTLIELLVVVGIVGILAAAGVPVYRGYIEKARNNQAIVDITEMESVIVRFMVENQVPPNNLNQVGLGNRLDPWGRPYEYLRIQGVDKNEIKEKWRKDHFNVPVNTDFDLYSMGKDGKSESPFTAHHSRDDIVRANNGRFIGLAKDY